MTPRCARLQASVILVGALKSAIASERASGARALQRKASERAAAAAVVRARALCRRR